MGRFLEGVNVNFFSVATTPIFLIGFLLLVSWVYRRKGKKHYFKMGNLPLNED